MEINYDLIIDYLVNNNIKKFTTVKGSNTYSIQFPNKFKNIFTDKFYRYGVTINDDDNNISFWSSILTLLDKKFIIPYDNDEIIMINTFKNNIIEKYSKKNISSFIKNNDKNDIKERLKLSPDVICIQYLVDIMNINIFIFDFKNENIHAIYHDNMMDITKPSILLANYEGLWEPIMLLHEPDVQKIFDYNDEIIKKLLNYEITYYDEIKANKTFSYKNVIDSDDNLISTEIDYKILSKAKLNKLKLEEIISIAKKLDIDIIDTIKKKKLTKNELIVLIENKKV